jgi:RimJ/RimL family protein N-acetyltransferase
MTERQTLPVLQGDRIRLRAYRDNDADALFAIYSDPKVMRYWSYSPWSERAQAEAYLRRNRDYVGDAMLAWAIALRDDDALIGTVTLLGIDRVQGRADVGYALSAAQWGKGLANEAVRLALAHAFDALPLRRIEADVDPRNDGSCRLLERLGFTREGLLRERWKVAGELQDSAIYGLLRGELK